MYHDQYDILTRLPIIKQIKAKKIVTDQWNQWPWRKPMKGQLDLFNKYSI